MRTPYIRHVYIKYALQIVQTTKKTFALYVWNHIKNDCVKKTFDIFIGPSIRLRSDATSIRFKYILLVSIRC